MEEKVKQVAKDQGKTVPQEIEGLHLHGGKITDKADNIYLLMTHWNKCPYQFRYNALTHKAEIRINNGAWTRLQDTHARRINSQLRARNRTTGSFSRESVWSGLYDLAYEDIFDPIQNYIDSVAEQSRNPEILETWLIDTFDANDSPLVRAMSRLTILGAAKRMLHPGCQFDTMLIIESPQGTAKTSLVKALCPKMEWFTSSVNMKMDDKTIIERTRNKVIVEIPELKNFREADIYHVKDFISRTTDSARAVWERENEERPRSFIFIGTTNEDHYLKDKENRRFWPVKVNKYLSDDELEHFRLVVKPQLWNEAFIAIRANPSLDVKLPKEMWDKMAIEQRARVDMIVEEWQGLPVLLKRCWKIPTRVINRLFFPNLDSDKLQNLPPTSSEKRTMGIALRRCGWERATMLVGGESKGCWKGPKPEDWSEIEQFKLLKEYLESQDVSDIDDSDLNLHRKALPF